MDSHKQFTEEFGQIKCSRFNKDECGVIKQSIGLCDYDDSKRRCVPSYKMPTYTDSIDSTHKKQIYMDTWDADIRKQNPKKIAFESTDTSVNKSLFINILRSAVKHKLNHESTKYILP